MIPSIDSVENGRRVFCISNPVSGETIEYGVVVVADLKFLPVGIDDAVDMALGGVGPPCLALSR